MTGAQLTYLHARPASFPRFLDHLADDVMPGVDWQVGSRSARNRVVERSDRINPMPKNKDADSEKGKEYRYWRVIVTYNDGETSGNRVFKDRAKAERFAARQEQSLVVKKAVLERFVRQQYGGRRVFKRIQKL